MIRRGLPDPHPGHPVQQRRHGGEGGQRREAEARVALGVPGKRQPLGGEDALPEIARRQSPWHAGRQRAGKDWQEAEQGNTGQHDDPAPTDKPGMATAHLTTISGIPPGPGKVVNLQYAFRNKYIVVRCQPREAMIWGRSAVVRMPGAAATT